MVESINVVSHSSVGYLIALVVSNEDSILNKTCYTEI